MEIKVSAILLMAGSGQRFGNTIPKQFHDLGGKKIYQHTLEKFQTSQLFHEIVLVCPPDWMVHEEGVKSVAGGATRQESSFKGLSACDPTTQYVVIHDAVRPFVSLEILQENVAKVQQYDATDTCIPSSDTIVQSADGIRIDEIPLRSEYWQGQTPQSFAYDLILEAHRRTRRKNVSDDCSLVLEMGCEIYLVRGNEENLKITTELDLAVARNFLESKTSYRSTIKS
jgi:2-C-methyl-D-erythritol 4-phosphate cytidylyltransferase